jgi:hypothetical protein
MEKPDYLQFYQQSVDPGNQYVERIEQRNRRKALAYAAGAAGIATLAHLTGYEPDFIRKAWEAVGPIVPITAGIGTFAAIRCPKELKEYANRALEFLRL